MTFNKGAARKKAFAKRKRANQTGVDDAANIVLQRLLSSQHGQVVAGYMPIKTEISPLPTLELLHKTGKTICLPVVVGPDQPLLFRVWTPDCAMQSGAFGALIPASTQTVTPEIVIVPLVAFDKMGNRLGYGGGFYDRTLEKLAYGGGVSAIGFGYAAQQVAKLPSEKTDYVLDYVVTEKEILSF